MAVIPEHHDILGQPLGIGDAVVFPSSNTMYVGTITKLNPKMVKVIESGRKPSTWYTGSNKYPSDLVKVDGPEVTMYLLKMNTAA